MSSQLAVLPAELVELIADRVQPADLLSFRLVCRLLRAKSIQCFGRTFFSVVRSDLSLPSLEKLKSISEHEQLKDHVQGLLIKEYNPGLGHRFHWPRSPSGHVMAPMPCVDALRPILLNDLVHCRSFHVYREHESEEDYAVDCLTTSDAAAIIFTIVAETALPIKSFHLDFTKFGTPNNLDMKRLHTPDFPGSQSSGLISGWRHLEELVLEYTISAESLSLTMGLVLFAPHLQTLKIGPRFSDDGSASGLFFERLSASDALPAVRELSISGVTITGPTLTRFILRFGRSLCTLSFQHVMITSPDTWATLFLTMKSNFPLLKHLRVQHLNELQRPKARIIFPLLEKDNEVPETGGRTFELKYKTLYRQQQQQQMVVGAEYSGPGVDMALEVLARAASGFI